MDTNPQDPPVALLMQHLKANFQAAASPEQATLQLTTKQVFDKLQALYPSPTYSPLTVFKSLIELNYLFHDPHKDLSYVWLFK